MAVLQVAVRDALTVPLKRAKHPQNDLYYTFFADNLAENVLMSTQNSLGANKNANLWACEATALTAEPPCGFNSNLINDKLGMFVEIM